MWKFEIGKRLMFGHYETCIKSAINQLKVYQYHINDTEFAKALVDSFLEITNFPDAKPGEC